jgi:hypothetical protein
VESPELGVLTPRLRNSRTACRNSVAPALATTSAPPAVSTRATMANAATRSSHVCADGGEGVVGHRSLGCCMRTCAMKAQNITSVP